LGGIIIYNMSDIVMNQRPHGVYSESHWLLTRVTNHVRKYRELPTYDTTKALYLYKTKDEVENDIDIWSRLYNPPEQVSLKGVEGDIFGFGPNNLMNKSDFTRHVHLIDTPIMRRVFNQVFTLNSNILENSEQYISKYNLDTKNTHYVYYRGNDKLYYESLDVPIKRYIDHIESRVQTPEDVILVQTDVYDFYNNIKARFPCSVMIEETWIGVPEDRTIKKAIHKDLTHNPDNIKNIISLLGSMYIGAQCKSIISNTSGFSLFLQLFRCLVFNLLSEQDTILYTRDPELADAEARLPQFK